MSLKKLERASIKDFPLRDADCYAMIRERATWPMFPATVPVGAIRADFRFTPRIMQGAGVLALRLELESDELQRHEMLVRRAAVAALPKDKPGPFFEYVLDTGVPTWPPSKKERPSAEARVYLLSRSGHSSGELLKGDGWSFNHGAASGVTVDEAFGSVLYWSLEW